MLLFLDLFSFHDFLLRWWFLKNYLIKNGLDRLLHGWSILFQMCLVIIRSHVPCLLVHNLQIIRILNILKAL